MPASPALRARLFAICNFEENDPARVAAQAEALGRHHLRAHWSREKQASAVASALGLFCARLRLPCGELAEIRLQPLEHGDDLDPVIALHAAVRARRVESQAPAWAWLLLGLLDAPPVGPPAEHGSRPRLVWAAPETS